MADLSSGNFDSERNKNIEHLLSEAMTSDLILFSIIIRLRIFQLFGDYLASNAVRLVIPRKQTRELKSDLQRNICLKFINGLQLKGISQL